MTDAPDQSLVAPARCVAGMIRKLSKGEVEHTVSAFETDVGAKRISDGLRALALLVLAEVGRELDLASHKQYALRVRVLRWPRDPRAQDGRDGLQLLLFAVAVGQARRRRGLWQHRDRQS